LFKTINERDGSNEISMSELKDAFKRLNVKASDSDLREIMRRMDKDGSGSIDFDEFVEVMYEQFYRKYEISEIKAAFRYKNLIIYSIKFYHSKDIIFLC
jgi:Ca2+-binding EF-hand superfamily protein